MTEHMADLFSLLPIAAASVAALAALWSRFSLARSETDDAWLDRNW